MGLRHIDGLGAVIFELMQFKALGIIRQDEFPIAITHGEPGPIVGFGPHAEPLPENGAGARSVLTFEGGDQVLTIAGVVGG